MKRILFFSVHPDDETLGCGGTILKHKNNKDDVYWVIITSANDEKAWGKKTIQLEQKQIEQIYRHYKFNKIIKLNFDATKLDTVPLSVLTTKFTEIITQIKPEVIYLHNRSDVHSDHQVSFGSIISATKSFRHPYIKRILMYETISETEFAPALHENAFLPNYFVDITKFIEKKIEIMKLYKSEIKEHPFPRSEKNIRALATFRGAQCGVEYAEAFMILKDIWK
jgi:LmbE family N-acetylglucosaminyl deacetylase